MVTDDRLAFELQMHDTGFFADIRLADILQLLWLIINTNTNIYKCFFPAPNCIDHQVFSVSIITHTLTILARRQMQVQNTELKNM